MDIGWLLGTGAVSSFVTGLVMRWLQKRDKREERSLAQIDSHRIELQRAYAAFIASYSRFLDFGQLLVGSHRALLEIENEIWERCQAQAYSPGESEAAVVEAGAELKKKSRAILDDYLATSADANSKSTSPLLLEDDTMYADRVRILAHSELASPQSDEDYDRFASDLIHLRKELDVLLKLLTGTFSPVRWQSGAHKALPGVSRPALPQPAEPPEKPCLADATQ